MGRELGRISGPLLADNLRRNGENLAFDNQVLFIDVVNNRIGFNSNAPVTDVYTPSYIKTINIIGTTTSEIANFTISTNQIQNVVSSITIQPNQSSNPTITTPGLSTDNLYIYGNNITNTVTNDSIYLTANGTGAINVTGDTLVNGSLFASGNITWDGNITLGSSLSNDTVILNGEVSSNIVPAEGFNLGSSSNNWANTYVNTSSVTDIDLINFTATTFTGSGTDNLQGNVTVGTTSANTLTINGSIDNNLIPNSTLTYDLGSVSKYWNNLYTVSLTDGNISISNNTLATTSTNSNLRLIANGTGNVVLSNLNLPNANNVSVGGTLNVTSSTTLSNNVTTNAITQTGSYNLTGNAVLGTVSSGNIIAANPLILPAIEINGSTITGLVNSKITLTAPAGQNVEINTPEFDNNVVVGGTLNVTGTTTLSSDVTTNAITQHGNYSVTGNVILGAITNSGNITAANPLTLPNITINNSTITGTANSILKLTAPTGQAVEITRAKFDNNVSLGGNLSVIGTTTLTNTSTGAITQVGSYNQTGNAILGAVNSGSITSTGTLTLPDVTISGSTITGTQSGTNLQITAHAGQSVEITSNTTLDGNTSVGGTLGVTGTTTLANTSANAITQTGSYNITGSAALGAVSSGSITAANPLILPTVEINGSTISGLANSILKLTAPSGKNVEITRAQFDNNVSVGTTLTVSGTTTLSNNVTAGAINQTGSYNQTGSATLGAVNSGSIISSDTLTLPDVTISGSSITGTQTNTNLTFTANGTGNVEITGPAKFDNNVTVATTLNVLDTSTLADTNTNAITQTGSYNITGNATLGSVSSGSITAANPFIVSNIEINNNTISSSATNSNLKLTPNGTGNVEITSPSKFDSNVTIASTLNVTGATTLTNTSTNAITQTGSYSITGSATLGTVNSGSITAANPLILPTVEINGSTISGLANSILKLTPFSGQSVEITGNTVFDNNVSVAGILTVAGATTLSDTTVGAITQTGSFNQTGNTTITGNLSAANIFVGGTSYTDVGEFIFDNSTISNSVTDHSITFTANGTGSVILDSVLEINQNNIKNVWGSIGVLNEAGVSFSIEDGTEFDTELGTTLPGSFVSTTQGSIFLAPTGTGNVVLNSTTSVVLPIGDDLSPNPLSTAGQIRFNDSNLNIEGYDSTGYINFINLYSQDHLTYITPELTPGTADNTLRFSINNTVTTTLTSSALTNDNMHAGNISITGNTISNLTSSNNIFINTSGTGVVNFDGVQTQNNSIYIPNTGLLTISSTGQGHTKFGGTYGVQIPSGPSSAYPSNPVTGTTRFNTTTNTLESYTGTEWVAAYGTSSAISADQVSSIVEIYTIILGF